MKPGMDSSGHGGLQSRPNVGTRIWSTHSVQGNGTRGMDTVATTREGIIVLRNGLERSITTYTCVKILQMCSKEKDLLAAKQVHDHVRQSGMDKNIYVAVSLVNVYIKCGALLDARQVFDQIEKKNVVTWTNMIAGYAKSGHAESALELFIQMRQEGVRPNEITCLSILKACHNPVALKSGKAVHMYIRHAGFQSDVRIGTALAQMYMKCGCITESMRVFEQLENRNLITWNVMIGGLARHGYGHEAYRMFLQMRREGLEPDAFTYAGILNAPASEVSLEWLMEVHDHASKAGLDSDLRVGNALIHMYAKRGSLSDARLIFDKMEKRDVVTWTVMIGGLAQRGCGHEAYRLFLQMRLEGFEPNAITYASILNASASDGALKWVKEIHGHARNAGLESDLRVGNALVHMYAKSGSITDARLIFDRLEKRDVVTWNIMICGLALHGCGKEALELFTDMNTDADGTSFVAVLSACCHSGLVDEGRRLFSDMTQCYGIVPEILHYNCMIDLLGRAGRFEEANIFITDMPIEPNAATWRALLGVCHIHSNMELGEVAAKKLFESEPSVASTYVLLSSIYAAVGKWDNVSLVRSMMEERSVRREPGRSSIEVHSKVHEFVVGDTSHP